MMKILIIIGFLLFTATLYAQNYIVQGKILDAETKSPVYNVHIKVNGIENVGGVSDENGHFFFSTNKQKLILEISHVAYTKKKREVSQKDYNNITIYLSKSIDSLPEATIIAHRIVNLVERKLYDVVDYEFMGDSILLLTYSWKDKINPWLILMNHQGDTIFRKPAVKEGRLYRDCMNNLHLITKDKAYQLFFDEKELYYLYPIDADSFQKILNPCLTTINQKFFIRQWSLHNQVLSYSIAKDKNYKVMRVISDEKAVRMLKDRNRFYSMGVTAPTEADIRFDEMCFFDPIYAPLLKIKDNVVIFNFVNDKIEVYDDDGQLKHETPIDFHKQKGWKEELISDEVTGKVYAVYKVNGLTKVREINIENGKTFKEIPVPEFKYIENVKAYNGHLYFMYRANEPMELTNLYKMEL